MSANSLGGGCQVNDLSDASTVKNASYFLRALFNINNLLYFIHYMLKGGRGEEGGVNSVNSRGSRATDTT